MKALQAPKQQREGGSKAKTGKVSEPTLGVWGCLCIERGTCPHPPPPPLVLVCREVRCGWRPAWIPRSTAPAPGSSRGWG